MSWQAGIWDQREGFRPWSNHRTKERAIKAAIRYARQSTETTGGRLTWCGGVRHSEDWVVTWYNRRGEVVPIDQ